MRLGIRQLELLRHLTTRLIILVGDRRTERLCKLGLCEAAPDGHCVRITSAGLRALVDAVDAGRLPLFEDDHATMMRRLKDRHRPKESA